jgi:hypothetical protein
MDNAASRKLFEEYTFTPQKIVNLQMHSASVSDFDEQSIISY